MTRRELLRPAVVAMVGLAQQASAEKPHTLRVGGPVFVKTTDPEALAEAHRVLGYRAGYAPEIPIHDDAMIRATVKAFAARDVLIAEVGAWLNLLDSNPEKRRKNLDTVTERLALADALGAKCCVDIAGSRNPDVWYGPDPRNLSKEFFDATVENCRTLIDRVKPRRTKFSIEMSPWTLPTTADEYLKLIRAVDRQTFGVHLDICNIVNSTYKMYGNADLIRETYAKLGPWILSCHVKDLKWNIGMAVCFEETVPGKGQMDFGTWVRAHTALPGEVPFMMEHMKSPESYVEGRKYILSVAHANDIRVL